MIDRVLVDEFTLAKDDSISADVFCPNPECMAVVSLWGRDSCKIVSVAGGGLCCVLCGGISVDGGKSWQRSVPK